MKLDRLIPLVLAALLASPIGAIADSAALKPLQVQARSIPVPDTVSPQMQQLIAAPYNPNWNQTPKSADEWNALIKRVADDALKAFPAMRERLGVKVEHRTIAGVPCFVLTPNHIPPANRNRLLVHVHGGAYVLFPGESGTGEAILMAGYGHFKVISVDYRMPPAAPYPAAMDDAMAVWKAAVKMAKPGNMAIFGTSTGGGMTLAMVQRAKAEHLPLPGAIAPGTPWSDLTETGDSYSTNEYVDNILVSNDGFLDAAAHLYANGLDLKDPHLSPVYGDFHGFPPTILTSGTRDLFLSNTVRVHRKLRDLGIDAQLMVYEGQSHAQYQFTDTVPETKVAFDEIAAFFDKHLGK
jgi:epsilon-lactone hydrolase